MIRRKISAATGSFLTKMVVVTLGPLACAGVESHFGADLAAGVRAAVLHYAGVLRSGRLPLPPPRFLPAPREREAGVSVELAIDAEDEALFERLALLRGTTVAELVVHAVLGYLAELEALGGEPGEGAGSDRGPAY